jgi:integrase
LFYLTRIKKTYQFRLRIPRDLLPYFPQKEIRRTLGTTRYREAKTLLHKFTAETERIFTLIRSNTLPEDTLKKIIDTYLDASITLFERQRNREPIFSDSRRQNRIQWADDFLSEVIESDEGFDLYQEMQEHAIAKDKRLLGRKKGQDVPRIAAIADTFLKKYGIELDKDSASYSKLCNELLKAKIKADKVNNEHLSGNYETDYDQERRNRKDSKTLKQLIVLYEKEKMQSWADPGRLQSMHRQILHILGDIPLASIDREVSINLRDALKEYPRSLKERDMVTSWRELAKVRKDRLSDGSQHGILTEYSTLIRYAKENDLGIKGSPAAGIAGDKDSIKRVKKRIPYTPQELQCLVAVLAQVDREAEPEVFWLPLLFLYTGARSNEVCMLRCEDIEERGGMWFLCFRNREEYHQKTKNDNDRQAPIHADLVRLGFLEFVEAQKASGKDRLFDNLVLYEGKWNKYYGKDYNRTFKQKFLPGYSKEQLSAKDLHTFRTTMISWFVQRKDLATVPNISILQSIVGHYEKAELAFILEFIQGSQLTINDYGGGYGKEHEQNELLQQLDYGLDLIPLL